MEKREIQIWQEYYNGDHGNEKEGNNFHNVYSIKIWAISLRELLMFKSLYYCKT